MNVLAKLREQCLLMMFTLFCLFSLSIGTLTLIALRNNGVHKPELKNTLNSMGSNFKALLGNLKTLLTLLIKDLFNNSSISENSPLNIKQDAGSNIISEIQPKVLDIESSNSNDDQDSRISEFCPEVMQLIEEEEEKAA